MASSVAWIPITAHILARLFPFFYPEGFMVTPLYRLIWWLSFYLSLLCLLYVTIESFRRYFDGTSRLARELSRNSYGVYIIHVIVIGVFGTLLLNAPVPAVMKYIALIASTYSVSNLVVSGYRFLLKTPKAGSGKFVSQAAASG